MNPEDYEGLQYLREQFKLSGFGDITDGMITTISIRVSGSIAGYAKKYKELKERPLPQMSDDAMQSDKWKDTPVYKVINNGLV